MTAIVWRDDDWAHEQGRADAKDGLLYSRASELYFTPKEREAYETGYYEALEEAE